MSNNNDAEAISNVVMDQEFFSEHTMHDKDLQQSLVEIFLDQSAKCIESMKHSLSSKDVDLWQKTAHMFRGSSMDMGFKYLAMLLQKAELESSLDEVLMEKIKKARDHSCHAAQEFVSGEYV